MKNLPINHDCPLTDKEIEILKILLDKLEWETLTPFKTLSGIYSDSNVDGYDEWEIEATLFWGVDGEWEDENNITIDRKTLTI